MDEKVTLQANIKKRNPILACNFLFCADRKAMKKKKHFNQVPFLENVFPEFLQKFSDKICQKKILKF